MPLYAPVITVMDSTEQTMVILSLATYSRDDAERKAELLRDLVSQGPA